MAYKYSLSISFKQESFMSSNNTSSSKNIPLGYTVGGGFLKPFVNNHGKTMGKIPQIAGILAVLIGLVIFALWRAYGTDRVPTAVLPQLQAESQENIDVNGLAAVSGDWQQQDSMAQSPYSHEYFVKNGGTLDTTLRQANLGPQHRYALAQAVRKVFDPRNLRNGQKIVLQYSGGSGKTDPANLHEMTIALNPGETIRVYRTNLSKTQYDAEVIRPPLVPRHVYVQGVIQSSLSRAALDGGVSPNVLDRMINMFSHDIDFQRQIRKGDTFNLFYERYHHQKTGDIVKTGKILMGEMVVNGKIYRYYRFTDKDGVVDYYNKDGVSARRALMKTPINGSRISSGYGKRKHPILGYTKMHRGVDFAAPRGTPIYAAGNGVIERASYYGTFGNFVQIRHSNGYQTRYAHMSRFANGMAKGKTVQQGDVIGYVGSTGRSTGPHLHYEILYNKKHINPATLKMPSGKTLKGVEYQNFSKIKDQLDQEIAQTKPLNSLS